MPLNNNRVERVAVVGAGGQSGKFIVDELLKTGKHQITAITRSDSTSAIADNESITIQKVDYANHSSLTAALRGHDALIITMGARAPPDQQTKLIDAAAA
ncbi:hypothetical protein LTS18_010293, partial [Coniosporium uncinatum]